jgi:hypothetical protein
MAGLIPAIHVLGRRRHRLKDADAAHKEGMTGMVIA